MTVHLDPRLRQTALTLAARLNDLKEQYVERDEAVEVLALAVLCREHALVIGPPGTAKTALVQRFCDLLLARRFSYLLTRFTEPAELFGPIDLQSFRDGRYRVNTDGMLPQADIAFLDEVFHGSSAILNTLLTLINERRFHNGAHAEAAHLITLFGATNEMPDDPLLLAFCDRFLFRCRIDYVPDEAIHDVLAVGWTAERRRGDGERGAVPSFHLEDLRLLQASVTRIDLDGVRDDLSKIVVALREEGVAFSDRRAVKAQKAIAAAALLAGRGRAEPEDLAVLTGLWTSPHDEATIRRIVQAHGVPAPASRRDVRDVAEVAFDLSRLTDQLHVVESREECREILRRLGRLLTEVRAGRPEAADLLAGIGQAQRAAVETLRERFDTAGFDV